MLISTLITTLLLSTGLALTPPAPTIEAQQLVEQVAPHAYVWRAESEQKQAQIDALERKLKQKDAELAQLKHVKEPATPSPKASAPTTTDTSGWQTGEFTAYYPANNAMQGGGITSKGDNLYQSLYYRGYRIIAAPPSVPFDTIVEIEVAGQTIKGIVRDRGGRIQGNKFDVTYADQASAVQFGRQQGKWRVVE
ncbi:hypothetical protein HB818_14455 [Listeria booriae]|uniref:3D domain-containing protein n=1 Tax=Listeria booriae TaxID=1552123 RepID=UPI0016281954|nr:3D domain-containing protein [Listeria booriae]MBC1286961.1 hypothetical protein [Listeria booriae]